MSHAPLPRCDFEASKLILRFEATLPADLDVIGPVVEGVMTTVRQMGCAAGREFEVQLAINQLMDSVRFGGAPHGCSPLTSSAPGPRSSQR